METNDRLSQQTTQPTDKYQQVSGWFAFFLFVIGLGSVVSLIYCVSSLDLDDYYNSKVFASVEIIYHVMYLLLAAYTIYSVLKRKPNAIFLCVTTAVYLVASNILVLIGGDFEPAGFGSLRTTVSSFCWSIIWVLYFIFSEQVNRLFPKETRKIYLRDKIIIVLLIMPMLFGFAYVYHLNSSGTSIEIAESSLAPDERTDGVIAFTVPDDYTCEVVPTDELTVFNLSNDDCNIMIIGAVDMDNSPENAETYFTALKDEDAADWRETCIYENVETKGKLATYHRTYKYTDPNEAFLPVKWDVYVIFDDATGKVAVVSSWFAFSAYSNIEEVVNSIRFK